MPPKNHVTTLKRGLHVISSKYFLFLGVINDLNNGSVTLIAGTCKRTIVAVIKVIRHVFGFGIEFLENKDICIFAHFILIDFIKRLSYHTYFSPISTS